MLRLSLRRLLLLLLLRLRLWCGRSPKANPHPFGPRLLWRRHSSRLRHAGRGGYGSSSTSSALAAPGLDAEFGGRCSGRRRRVMGLGRGLLILLLVVLRLRCGLLLRLVVGVVWLLWRRLLSYGQVR